MRRPLYSSLMFALCMAGCGGGGGNGGGVQPPVAQAPFGLNQRPSLGVVTLPVTGSGATFRAVPAFPSLPVLTQPVYATGMPGSNRIVVIEKQGRIRVFTHSPTASSVTTILDITGAVEDAGEQGLLGLAFDPDFTANRHVYVYYSMASPRRSRVSRFTWDAGTDRIAANTEKVIIEVSQVAPNVDFSNHKAGMIAFGPDGFLYIALGDGGGGGDPGETAQNRSLLLGKLLRLDVTPANPANAYDIPATNPFVGDGDPNTRDEIWAWGLRNPFRFSFDRQSGDLWLGDVGQNAWEEINLIERGGNYGWCEWEGNQIFDATCSNLPQASFEFPIHTYGRAQGASVTGGVVYRGAALPALVGRYVYGDYVTGRVWALGWNGSAVTSNVELDVVNGPVAFGEDNAGELLIVQLGGTILKLEDTGGGGGGGATRLSETGIFVDLSTLTAAPGFIEYGINVPFWSDGTTKRRWLAVPNGQRITFSATGAWTFPVGTILVKHFEIALTEDDPASARRLETRVLTRRPLGWEGFTYRWNEGETDADLLAGRESETITVQTSAGARQQVYDYPSRTDCLQCHTTAAGVALGVRTRQLNRTFAFPNATDNQLRTYNHIGLFATDIGSTSQYGAYPVLADASASVASRARTYLDVNCAQCHRPNGPTGVAIDLRYDTANAQMNAIGAMPQAGTLGIANARIIAAGSKETSVLWQRMRSLDGNRMPPLSSHLVDTGGVELIGAWIDAL
jgi:uncharacterized repeat protein (TIGR03806 family)